MRMMVHGRFKSFGGIKELHARLKKTVEQFLTECPEPPPGEKTYETRISLTAQTVTKWTDTVPYTDTELNGLPFEFKRMHPSNCPKNSSEALFWKWAKDHGYTPTKKGWPDFFIVRPGTNEVACVEVKPQYGRNLKHHQRIVALTLAAYGIPCFKWCPDTGFQRIGIWNPHEDTEVKKVPLTPPAKEDEDGNNTSPANNPDAF